MAPDPTPQPLLDRPASAPLFMRASGPVPAGVFLAHARAVAAALPEGQYLLNLCRDRYAFAVALAAGLLRGRTALLNVDAGALPGVLPAFPGCTAVSDIPLPGLPVPVTLVEPDASARPDPGPAPGIPADHLAAVVFTSGSTGAPVPHPKRWGALVACSRAAGARFGFGAGATIVGTVPPQHMYGLETTVLLPWHAPVASWCGPAFFPADIAAALGAVPGPRTLVTTPLQIRTLLVAGTELPGIGSVVSATAPLAATLAADAEAAWGAPVFEIFGATECGSIASRRTVEGPAWFPYPGTTVRMALDGATVEAPGAPPVALADLLEEAPGGGFRLLGRRTDVVKLGGRRASLPGLNQVLTALPGVEDGAFVVPDDLEQRSTARLLAVVVAPDRSAPSILAALRGRIDPVFLPRRVIRVDALPRNALGKLPRQALLQLVDRAG